MKTVSVALVLCLNVGVDPPDVVKISPCARLECWIGKDCPSIVSRVLLRILKILVKVLTSWLQKKFILLYFSGAFVYRNGLNYWNGTGMDFNIWL